MYQVATWFHERGIGYINILNDSDSVSEDVAISVCLTHIDTYCNDADKPISLYKYAAPDHRGCIVEHVEYFTARGEKVAGYYPRNAIIFIATI